MIGIAIIGLRGARRGVGHDALCLDTDAVCAGLLLVALDTVQAAAVTGSSGLLPLGQGKDGVFEVGAGVCVANLVVVLVVGTSWHGAFALVACLCRRCRESVKHGGSVARYTFYAILVDVRG